MACGITIDVGESIPASTDHAVSVSLPTWDSNVGYEEGEEWVVQKMKTGYPRFFIHKSIVALKESILGQYNSAASPRPKSDGDGEDSTVEYDALVFPTNAAASRALSFIVQQDPNITPEERKSLKVLDLTPNPRFEKLAARDRIPHSAGPGAAVALFPKQYFSTAKAFWQHTGEGVSSRRAEFVDAAVQTGLVSLTLQNEMSQTMTAAGGRSVIAGGENSSCPDWSHKGPRRYQSDETRTAVSSSPSLSSQSQSQSSSVAHTPVLGAGAGATDSDKYIEERFGRNLDLSKALEAKQMLKRRIVAAMNGYNSFSISIPAPDESSSSTTGAAASVDASTQPSMDDVFLYPCGMNAIFHVHQHLLQMDNTRKSIEFGFPYIDTLKVLQKFGPGCLFYGHGSEQDLDDLEARLEAGERYLALFCEFPSNPLLKSPNLVRIKELADKYDFLIVVDETIASFCNVDLLPCADIIVSSLTKIFSGDSNVMGGSAVLNPRGLRYRQLKSLWKDNYFDALWAEDAVFLERNSRDFFSRSDRICANAEAVCDLLVSHPAIKQVYYPKINPTRENYERFRRPSGRYGGLLSATFKDPEAAKVFFDALETAKGPSLGTNFTLTSPYVLLAHYNELDWAAEFGVEANLIRFSVGLEPTEELIRIFSSSLAAVEA